MKDTVEKQVWRISGFVALVAELAIVYAAARLIKGALPAMEAAGVPTLGFWVAVGLIVVAALAKGGFFVIHPNEAKAFTFVGTYVGSCRDPGFHWTNPFVIKKAVMLRVRNFAS